MGVYLLYSGEDGESHIEELSAEAMQEIKLEGAEMNLACPSGSRGLFPIIIRRPSAAGRWDWWAGRLLGSATALPRPSDREMCA